MEIKPNNPLIIAIAVILIVGAILLINSTKVSTPATASPQSAGSGNQAAPAGGTGNPAVTGSSSQAAMDLADVGHSKAQEFVGIDGYINANSSLTLASLKGDVVLIDFWTYSCINCIRTLPYLEAWYQKYSPMGLVIVGVHSPEFNFEKNISNVQQAVTQYGITYPVLLDSDHLTWDAYQNLYWPEDYLLDANGYIRYQNIGEGNYNQTEGEIQELLRERDSSLQPGGLISGNVSAAQVNFSSIGTPEIYLGYSYARAPLGNPEGFQDGQNVSYTLPQSISPNLVYFNGTWENNPDNMELVSDSGEIVLEFQAKNLNIVAGGNSTLDLALNGTTPTQDELGTDAQLVNGNAQVNSERLYDLINESGYSQQTITITAHGPGFRIYTFTFG
jgi:thiol-disulfide isomerase/thioredoxin